MKTKILKIEAIAVIISTFIIMALLCLIGCKKDIVSKTPATADNSKLTAKFIDMSDCKNKKGLTATIDSVEYYYTPATKTLLIKRFNAAFNCYPFTVLIDVKMLDGNLISVTERDSMQMANCDCLFDFQYTIKPVEEATYNIIIHEPYVGAPDPILQFTVDLHANPVGRYSVQRHSYPWGI